MLEFNNNMKLNNLTDAEKHVIIDKGTEPPFSGEFDNFDNEGIFICRQCNAYLYRSSDKFDSGCGWPSFDDEIGGAIEKQTDSDGHRTEILCNRCGGHLGHVFVGENQTPKNIRHCVNSVSMKFINISEVKTEEVIYLGGGCFWCIEAVFKMITGVISVRSGYSGGEKENPTYDDVCTGTTGHAEVVEIKYNPTTVSLEKILSVFFDSHDPTTLNRQGNDVGTQYRSIVLATDQKVLDIVENFIKRIQSNYSEKVVTELKLLNKFYPAEDYHDNYFALHKENPYCQIVISPKIDKIKKKYLK